MAHAELKREMVLGQETLSRAMVKLNDSIKDVELKVLVWEKLEKEKRSSLKKSNNDHRMSLRSLLAKAGKSVPPNLRAAATSSLSPVSGFDSSLNPVKEDSFQQNNETIVFGSPNHQSTPARPEKSRNQSSL